MRTQLNVRLPEHTIAQIQDLATEMDESQAHVIIIAVDRLHVENKETKMSRKFNATVEAVEKADYWMGGAVVVKTGIMSYEAIPSAHLSDGSYTGSRDVVIDLSNGLENATGYSLSDGNAEEIAELLLN